MLLELIDVLHKGLVDVDTSAVDTKSKLLLQHAKQHRVVHVDRYFEQRLLVRDTVHILRRQVRVHDHLINARLVNFLLASKYNHIRVKTTLVHRLNSILGGLRLKFFLHLDNICD